MESNLSARSPQRKKQLLAAGLYAGIGIVFLSSALSYEMGPLRQMGPGYFPTIMAVLLLLIAAAITLRAFDFPRLRDARQVEEARAEPTFRVRPRPLFFVIGSILLFGFTVETIGLALALFLLVVVCRLAEREGSFVSSIASSVVITMIAILIFHTVIGVPIALWPSF